MKKTYFVMAMALGLSLPAMANTEHNHQHNNHQHHAAASANDVVDESDVAPFTQEYLDGMHAMHEDMMTGILNADADLAFAKGMLPHHEGAVAMAKTELKFGKDPAMRKLAEEIIAAQEGEIKLMQDWITARPEDLSIKADDLQPFNQAYLESMDAMHEDMMSGILSDDPDLAFAKGMLPHHEGAVAMAKIQLEYGKDETMRKLAEDIIAAQEGEIKLMQDWIKENE